MKGSWLMRKFPILTAALFAALFASAATNSIPWRVPAYTLTARNMPVREALETFGVAEGVPVVMSAAVDGSFSGAFKALPASEFLDRVATLHNLTWYYDGASIYVYASGEIRSALMDLAYMKADDVRALLADLGVEDARFPLKTASNDEIIMVSGPPRYVELVLETIARADRLKQLRTFNEIETRIFPLRYTWADSVSLASGSGTGGSGTGTAQITGVAQLLTEIMAERDASSSREVGVSTNGQDTVEAKIREALPAFTPVIRPENRLNAVIVRDAAPKMPMYERLIAELDRPQQLVEISVVTVEMSRDDALDWQLSLSLEATKEKYQTTIGQNPANLFARDMLPGLGLAGALTYIGNNFDVSASLTALKKKGKARSVSRTSLLTMNNLSAQISDTQCYHARVVGKEVASLEEVSAGTRLAISPRIAKPVGRGEKPVVWLTMDLQDGGFESVAVDSMPMTRTTSLETQAAVTEGQSVLLAGYFRDVEEQARWGIPYLRDIPYIGWIFGGVSRNKAVVQRLFVLTPYVVDFGPGSTDEQSADIIRRQAARQRSTAFEDRLVRDSDVDDEHRDELELKLREQDEIRREGYEDRMTVERGEQGFRREKRKLSREELMRDWQRNLDERRREWEFEKAAAEAARKVLEEGGKDR